MRFALHHRLRRPLRAAVCAVSLLAGFGLCAEPQDPLDVKDVRFWSLGEATRIAVETTGDFTYHYGHLPNPDRIYFDVVGARWPLTGARIHEIVVNDGLVKRIRVAQTTPSITRVVVDLEVPVEFSAAQLANPSRLMIEVRPAAPKPAARTANARERKPVVTPPHKTVAQPPVEAPSKSVVTLPAASAPMAEKTPLRTAEKKTAAEKRVEKEVERAAVEKPAGTKVEDEQLPQPAERTSAGSRTLVRTLGLKLGRVVIDPGHGGHDTGTIGRGGLYEKDLVLDVALRLGALIEKELGADVLYTRSDDTFVPLAERTALANEKKADLFLSIHANAGARSAAGPETYYLNFTTSRDALDVAARENAISDKSIHELQSLIEKIALKDKIDESREFAENVQAALQNILIQGKGVKDRGVRKAPFVVLIGAQMPSVLAEIAFLSNPKEERLLKRPEYRNRIARGLYRGVSKYASSLSHFQVASGK